MQMSQVTVEKCMEIITEFEPSPQGRQLAQLGIDGTCSRVQCVTLLVDSLLIDVCCQYTASTVV